MMPIVGHTFVADDGRVWDLGAGIRFDPDGSQHAEATWSTREATAAAQWRTVIFRRDRIELIRSEIAVLRARAAAADADANATTGLLTAVQNRADTIRATPLGSITPAAIREELALACDRDAGLLVWRGEADALLAKLCIDLAWLAEAGGVVAGSP